MAQAGIHAVVGLAVRKVAPRRTWLILGIVLGNLLPDADNLAVAFATLTGSSTHGLHRTFTHSLITTAILVGVFYLAAAVRKAPRWGNLGLGLGIGIVMHILLDLVIWFNGVEILWPLPLYVNLWENAVPPEWWMKLMMPVEMLFLAFFFVVLIRAARKQGTNGEYLSRLRFLTWVQAGLFVVFTVLVYTLNNGFMTIFGTVYLLSLGLAFNVTLRMKETVEAHPM
jgi:membrane-bound metal-dependent hydrolase YbcI (DUF457 family)